jgi:hypothetical protein
LVTALMLDLGIYTVRKSDPQNMARYEQICQTLLRYVDRNGWNPAVHERALKDRLQTKMGLIKKQLIKEGRIQPNGAGAYVKTGSAPGVIGVGGAGAAAAVATASRAAPPAGDEDGMAAQRGNERSFSADTTTTTTPTTLAARPDVKSEPPMSVDERSSPEPDDADPPVDVAQVKRLMATLNLDETSEVMGFVLDKLDGTDMFWTLLVEQYGSPGAAEIERNLAEVLMLFDTSGYGLFLPPADAIGIFFFPRGSTVTI